MQFPSVSFSVTVPKSYSPVYKNEAQSLKTIVTGVGAHRWEFELTTGILKGLALRSTFAFLNARGVHESFQVVVPYWSQPLGHIVGAVSVVTRQSIGANTIEFKNYTPASGDFFKFAGHAKVYQIETATANNATANTGTFYPRLISAVGRNEGVVVNDVPFTVRNTTELSKLTLDLSRQTKLKINCEEVV